MDRFSAFGTETKRCVGFRTAVDIVIDFGFILWVQACESYYILFKKKAIY